MTAPHFFAPDVSGAVVALGDDESRHALRVLRMRPGEAITISNGHGDMVRATVIDAGPLLTAAVAERRTVARPEPRLVMFCAIPKAGKLDLVVQKLTELGVDAIQPFRAARSIARWDPGKAKAQTERLNTIAHEAAKQSRRAWLPEVRPPASLDEIALPAVSFVVDEEARTPLRESLPVEAPETVAIVVGPEGGLEREEVAALAERGAPAASLGPLILRTETAALVAAAVVGVRYGLLG